MAIKFKNLQQIADNFTVQKYVYKDLYLDIDKTKIEAPGYTLPIPGTDIKADFDTGAIINSLTNLFNTLPGQRFLFPEYGLDLYQYVFAPISVLNGELIGRKIFNAIKVYEPRVVPRKVDVVADPDRSQYNISIIIEIPVLSIVTQPEFVLNIRKQSFIFLPTSRNK